MNTIRGDRFRQLREQRKLTQGQVAGYAGLSQSYVSDIESGVSRNVGSVRLANLARLLRTSADYLIGRTNDPRQIESTLDALDEDTRILAILYGRLRSPQYRQAVLSLARSLAEQEAGYEAPPDAGETDEKRE